METARLRKWRPTVTAAALALLGVSYETNPGERS
jgi:hypothetical protein